MFEHREDHIGEVLVEFGPFHKLIIKERMRPIFPIRTELACSISIQFMRQTRASKSSVYLSSSDHFRKSLTGEIVSQTLINNRQTLPLLQCLM